MIDIPRGRPRADCPMGVFPPTRERCHFPHRQSPCIQIDAGSSRHTVLLGVEDLAVQCWDMIGSSAFLW